MNIRCATQAADAPGSKKDAMYLGANQWNMIQFHFVSEKRLAKLRKEMYASYGNVKVGDYFHALEDTYAHSTGVGDRNWEYYQDLNIGPDIGHGMHGHDPDFTWKDPEKAMKMAEMVFSELRLLAAHTGQTSPPSEWGQIIETVQAFVWEPTG